MPKKPKPADVFPKPYPLTSKGSWDKEWVIDAGGIAVMVDHDDVNMIKAEALAYRIQLLPALIAFARIGIVDDAAVALEAALHKRLNEIDAEEAKSLAEYAAEQDEFNDVPDDLPGQD